MSYRNLPARPAKPNASNARNAHTLHPRLPNIAAALIDHVPQVPWNRGTAMHQQMEQMVNFPAMAIKRIMRLHGPVLVRSTSPIRHEV
jgi:hypothetical protein